MIIRAATEADLQNCTDIWQSTQPELGGGSLPVLPLFSHEMRTGRLVVQRARGLEPQLAPAARFQRWRYSSVSVLFESIAAAETSLYTVHAAGMMVVTVHLESP